MPKYRNRSFHNLLVPQQRAGSSLLIHDQFTDTNGVHLHDHAVSPVNVPSATWTDVESVATIQSNRAYCSAATVQTCYLDTGIADALIEASVSTVAAAHYYSGILFRCTDSTHNWRARINYNSLSFDIVEVNGSLTVRASAYVGYSGGVEYPISVTFSGQNISATFSGTTTITYNSATMNQTVTKHGVYFRLVGCTVDEFKVSRL